MVTGFQWFGVSRIRKFQMQAGAIRDKQQIKTWGRCAAGRIMSSHLSLPTGEMRETAAIYSHQNIDESRVCLTHLQHLHENGKQGAKDNGFLWPLISQNAALLSSI
jgi:hypothetical protein